MAHSAATEPAARIVDVDALMDYTDLVAELAHVVSNSLTQQYPEVCALKIGIHKAFE